jgi:hypothetical protein
MKCIRLLIGAALCVGVGMATVNGQPELTPEQKTKVTDKMKIVEQWGVDPAVVKAVADYNATPPEELKSMTQEKWKIVD